MPKYGMTDEQIRGMVAVAEDANLTGWREVDPEDQALALDAVRRAALEALWQKLPPEKIYAVITEETHRYKRALEQGEATRRAICVDFGLDPDAGPKFLHSRRMAEEKRLRYRFFVSGVDKH